MADQPHNAPNPSAPQPQPQVGRAVTDPGRQTAPQVPAGVTAAQMAPPAPAAPVHGPDGKLSRAAMESIVRGGGSVAYRGRVISGVNDLPSEIELAGDDQKALDNAEADLDRREQSLAAERSRLAAARRQTTRDQSQPEKQAPPPKK